MFYLWKRNICNGLFPFIYKLECFLLVLPYYLKCFNITTCITKRNHMWTYHLIFFFCNFIKYFFSLGGAYEKSRTAGQLNFALTLSWWRLLSYRNQSKKATDFFQTFFKKRTRAICHSRVLYNKKPYQSYCHVNTNCYLSFFFVLWTFIWLLSFLYANITDDIYDTNSISRDRKAFASFISCDRMVPVHVASLLYMFWRAFLIPLNW